MPLLYFNSIGMHYQMLSEAQHDIKTQELNLQPLTFPRPLAKSPKKFRPYIQYTKYQTALELTYVYRD